MLLAILADKIRILNDFPLPVHCSFTRVSTITQIAVLESKGQATTGVFLTTQSNGFPKTDLSCFHWKLAGCKLGRRLTLFVHV
jgi:hypothetical protein